MEYTNIFYVLASVLFILGIKKLSHPKTARHGNFLAFIGMLIAIAVTLLSYGDLDFKIIAIFAAFFFRFVFCSAGIISVNHLGNEKLSAIFFWHE